MKRRICISLGLVVILFWPANLTFAQGEQPAGPLYIVQEGDTLWDIAQRFGISLEDLRRSNNIADPSLLAAGDQLVIPGLEGVEGVLITVNVPYGENLRSLSRRYRVPVDMLVRLNRLTGSGELVSGANLILPQDNASTPAGQRISLTNGQSALELAVSRDANPWSLVIASGLQGTWEVLPGDVLRLPGEAADEGPGAFPGEITAVEVSPIPLVQGGTTVIRMRAQSDLTASGSLVGHELHFFEDTDGSYVALQGVHAMTTPGLYPLSMEGTLEDGTPFAFSQMVPVIDGGYYYEKLVVSSETLDPKNTEPEDEIWNSLPLKANTERLWEGVLQSPVSPLFADCFPSLFGSRRSYNGSPYNYFHTGLGFCGGVGAEIYAPAPGVVIFTAPLTVRGNATMIDHGWGVYTGYMHQSEILVEEGDRVKTGQVIGLIGGTGRVTGSHLHLEVWVGGVQVNPMEWLERSFP